VIYKRGGFYHYQFQINGKRYRGSTKSTNKAEALRLEAERRIACLANPEESIGVNEKLGLDVAFERFLSWASRHVKPRTHQRYRVSAKRLTAHFGETRIERMNTQVVEGFKSVRASECTSAGVNRDLACLRTFRNWCVRMGYPIGRVHVQLLREGPGNVRIVSYEEERIYMNDANPLLRDVSTIIVETGMRPGEVFGACGEHINLDERYIFIPTGKTRFARRTIPLTSRAYGTLGKLWKRGKLFEGVATNQLVMRRHKELCKRLGFDFRLYDFRHTYGSRMAMAGVDLMTLKELMGHSSVTLTQRYCHPTPEHKVSAMERLEAYNAQRATKKPQSQTEAIQ
jgi:integrase